jgi:hypothetical protein
VLIAAAWSYFAGWPRILGLPLVPLAVLLVLAGVSLSGKKATQAVSRYLKISKAHSDRC